MMKKRFNGKRGAMALGQVLILLIGTVAIAYVFGSSLGEVAAASSLKVGATFHFAGDSSGGIDNYTIVSETHISRSNGDNYYYSADHCQKSLSEPNWVGWFYSTDGKTVFTLADQTAANKGTAVCMTTNFLTAAEGATLAPTGNSGSGSGNGGGSPTPAPSTQSPSTTNGAPSGAGNSLVQQCIDLFGNSGSDFINCMNGISTTAQNAGNLVKKISETGKGSQIGEAQGNPGTGLHQNAGGVSNWVGWGILANIGEIAFAATVAWGVYTGLNWVIGLIPGSNVNSAGAQLGIALLSGASVGLVLGAESLIPGVSVPTVFGLTGAAAAFAWAGIGAAVALVLYFIFYKQHSAKAVQFTCIPWQAPLGGSECKVCGENGLPCTAYECASLGQNCQLLNSGTTGKQICTTVNVNNRPPVMTFWNETLPSGYTVSPLGASVLSSSGDTGVLVSANTPDGNVPAYTSLVLGIQTDKPSVCAFSPLRIPVKDPTTGNDTFSQLNLMDAGLYLYNHTLQIPQIVNSPTGEMELYIRCHDANDPEDYTPNYFIIKFGMQKVTDHSNPVVLGTDLQSGSTLPYGVTYTDVSIYVSKAVSECRWSHTVQDYSDMSSNKLDCSKGTTAVQNGVYYSVSDGTAQSAVGTYICVANLTGIQKGQTNQYYFRCNDTLGDVNNANPPASFSIKGSSQGLAITSASPNNTVITGIADSVKVVLDVKTFGGLDNQGTARCYYNDTVNTNAYSLFANTGAYESTNPIWLPAGDYSFPIVCSDAAGDSAFTTLKFNVTQDTTPPSIVRVYKDNSNLAIVTSKNATCVYDTTDCTYLFKDGIPMTDLSGTLHEAPWVTGRTYYIKCQDSLGLGPETTGPNVCTSGGIVQPSDL